MRCSSSRRPKYVMVTDRLYDSAIRHMEARDMGDKSPKNNDKAKKQKKVKKAAVAAK